MIELICPPKRREARKADRRRAILEVANRSFLDRGYAETSMSTIAAELGGSKTTLWSYFPSKEALFAAVLDAKIEQFQQKLDDALIPSDGGTRGALQRFGAVMLGKITDPDAVALHRLIVGESGRFPEIGRAFAERGPDRIRARFCAYLRKEMDAGRLRDGDPMTAARQFIALCQSGCYLDRLWRPGCPSITDPARDIADAVDTFLAAWGPRAA